MKDDVGAIPAVRKYFSSAIKYIFLGVGILLLIGAILFYQNTQQFLAEATSTEGTVVEMVFHKGSSGISRRKHSSVTHETYTPVVQFRDFSGTEFEFKSNTGSNPPQYEIGDSIEILYRIDAPEQARIKSFFSLWGASFILVCMGSIFIAIGVF